jgi:hypothetical protein
MRTRMRVHGEEIEYFLKVWDKFLLQGNRSDWGIRMLGQEF